MRSETVATATAARTGKRRAAHNVAGKSVALKVAALGVVMAVAGRAKVARADWYSDPNCTDYLSSSFPSFRYDVTGSGGASWVYPYTNSPSSPASSSNGSATGSAGSGGYRIDADLTSRWKSLTSDLRMDVKQKSLLYWKDTQYQVLPQIISARIYVSVDGNLTNLYGGSATLPQPDVTLSSSVGGKVIPSEGGKSLRALVLKPCKVSYIRTSSDGYKIYSVEMPAFSAEGSLQHPGEWPGGIKFRLVSHGSASMDARGVTLSRSGAPSPKIKGDPNVTIDEAKDEWVDVDGTKHGHTRYSYETLVIDNTVVRTENTQTFNASRLGTWGAGTYTWQPSSVGDTSTTHTQVMPNGGLKKDANDAWVGTTSSGGEEKVITYTVSDNTDGATATAQYSVKLHDEYEVKDLVANGDEPRHLIATLTPGTARASNPIYPNAPMPAPKTCKYGYSQEANASQDWTHTVSKNASASAEGGLSTDKLLPFLSGKGIDFSLKGDAKIAVADETKSTQLNTQGFTYSLEPTITLNPGTESWPIINVISHRRTYNAWQFNSSGFVKELQVTVDTYENPPYEPRWAPPSPLPPPPPPTNP